MTGAVADTRVSDRSLRGFTGYAMKRAFNAIRADLTRALAPHGLRMVTFSALSVIADAPGLSQARLAGVLAIERPNLGPIVDELEGAGLIVRRRAAGDRRAWALAPTDRGRETLAAARTAVRAHDRRMTAGLTSAQRAALTGALAAIEARGETP